MPYSAYPQAWPAWSSMLAPVIGVIAAWIQLNEVPNTFELSWHATDCACFGANINHHHA